jgi:hypothetical protein
VPKEESAYFKADLRKKFFPIMKAVNKRSTFIKAVFA